jgi:hypothetical protein
MIGKKLHDLEQEWVEREKLKYPFIQEIIISMLPALIPKDQNLLLSFTPTTPTQASNPTVKYLQDLIELATNQY